MKIEGHYDKRADIAWLRFEYWDASRLLPAELLKMLPSALVTSRAELLTGVSE